VRCEVRGRSRSRQSSRGPMTIRQQTERGASQKTAQRQSKMQLGVDSFAAAISDPASGLTLSPVERMQHLLEEIELADKVGLDTFGIGEHHRAEFLDSAPVVILPAAAARTRNIHIPHPGTAPSAT